MWTPGGAWQASLARSLQQEFRAMNHRTAMRSSWFLRRLLHSMERALGELEGTGRTLPFLVNEWREATAYVRETGEPIPQPLEDPGEEQGARAWVQVLLDEIQGLLGRGGLRQILQLRPGEEIIRWADREARPWERLQALQCAMGELERGRPGRTHYGGARGSAEPMDSPGQHFPPPPVDGPDMPPSGVKGTCMSVSLGSCFPTFAC